MAVKNMIQEKNLIICDFDTAFSLGVPDGSNLLTDFKVQFTIPDEEGGITTITTMTYATRESWFRPYAFRKFYFKDRAVFEEHPERYILTEFLNFVAHNQDNFNRAAYAMYKNYDPLENFNGIVETVTTDSGNETLVHGLVKTESGVDDTVYAGGQSNVMSGSQDLDYSGSQKNTMKHGDIESTTSAFNNPNSYTPDNKQTQGNDEDTLTFTNRKDKTTYNNVTTTTTYSVDDLGNSTRIDSQHYGHKVTDSGSDVTNFGKSVSYTENRHGNLGVTKSQEMAMDELNLRMVNLTDWVIKQFLDRYTFY